MAPFESDILVSAAKSRAERHENKSSEQQVASRGVKMFRDFNPMFSTACQLSSYTLCLCGTKVSDFPTTSVCIPYQNFP